MLSYAVAVPKSNITSILNMLGIGQYNIITPAYMNHKSKVEKYLIEMKGRGLPSIVVAPPLYRLAWLLGSKVPPPPFQRFEERVAILRRFLFIGWSVCWILLSVYFYKALIVAPPLLLFLILTLAGGWAYASAVAARIAKEQDKRYAKDTILNLGDWKDYGLENKLLDGSATRE
jgi:hypothetical protein